MSQGELGDGPQRGDRIRLIYLADEHTSLRPGTEGTVGFVDALGTIHVNWDSGHRLGLVPGVDRWTGGSPRPNPPNG